MRRPKVADPDADGTNSEWADVSQNENENDYEDENENESVTEERIAIDFVTLGMFIIGEFARVPGWERGSTENENQDGTSIAI